MELSDYQYDPTKDGFPPKKIKDTEARAKWIKDHHDKDRHFTPPKQTYML